VKTGATLEFTRAENNWQRRWSITVSIILALGTLLRVCELNLKPLHHDESVNGFFLLGLFREGIYRYNPANYHGPTLYYFALISCSINNLLFGSEGPSTIAVRMVPVLFGIGIIGIVLAFRDRLGTIGALAASTLAAVSPGVVYLSRDFIHETLLVFFTLWLALCTMRFADTGKTGQILLGAIAAALMVCTKETAPLSFFSLLLGVIAAVVWAAPHWARIVPNFGTWRQILLQALAAFALFLLSSFLFFSSFFGNYPQGVRDAVTTYSYWARTGMTQQTAPWYTYLLWLIHEEAPIFILATVGAGIALIQRRDHFAIFAATWTFTLLVAYSIVPYKTPWILLNMIVPMCLVAGHAVQELWSYRTKLFAGAMRWLAPATLIAVVIAVCLHQSIQLNFIHYDDPRYVYPYVQTRRTFLNLIDMVNENAKSMGTGTATSVAVVAPEYWPLPWYLRDYKNTGYFAQVIPTNASLIIGSRRQQPELEHQLAGRYRFAGMYPMRPGVELVLFVSNRQTH
jgi:uncharacterized protein (TIGR03663 family)